MDGPVFSFHLVTAEFCVDLAPEIFDVLRKPLLHPPKCSSDILFPGAVEIPHYAGQIAVQDQVVAEIQDIDLFLLWGVSPLVQADEQRFDEGGFSAHGGAENCQVVLAEIDFIVRLALMVRIVVAAQLQF